MKARRLSDRRAELRTTLGQIDQIFSVPETVDELQDLLKEDSANLLEIHAKLAECESCRDALHSSVVRAAAEHGEEASPSDLATINTYFKDVTVMTQSFEQQLLFELQDPLELVTT